MINQTLKYHLLAVLTRKLKADKKELGIGQHLQLQQMIATLPEGMPLEQLKVVLTPLIAKNDQEQKRFYEIIEEAIEEVKQIQEAQGLSLEDVSSVSPQEKIEKRDRFWIIFIASVLGLTLLALLLGRFFKGTSLPPLETVSQSSRIQQDTIFAFLLDTSQMNDRVKPIQNIYFAKDSSRKIKLDSSVFGKYTLLENYYLEYTSRDTVGIDLIPIIFEGPDTIKQLLELSVTILPRSGLLTPVKAPIGSYPGPLFKKLPDNPFPTKDIASLQANSLSTFQQWLNKNIWWLRPFLTILSLFLIYRILRYRDRRRRKLVAEIEEIDQPPYVWTLELEEVPEIEAPTIFGRLLRQLRKRTGEDLFNLDVPQTIKATIDRGGMIDFRYRQQTRPPEYLFLIDRNNTDNHRAKLFDWMYHQFKAKEVFVERFFFDGDPRLCKNEKYPAGIRLGELQYKFPNARLLIFGQGSQLIDRRSGKISKWVKGLEQWKQRAILTPRPFEEWGIKERTLLSSFELLPATSEGLSYLVEQFDKLADRALPNQWKDQLKSTPTEAFEIDEAQPIINQLQHHFDSNVVKWIAGCAVYPALHWDLTLFLGDLTGQSIHSNLLTVPNLNQINQLPWFVVGKMSKEARSQLVTYLEKTDAAFLRKIRQELHELFQQQNIPEGSVAYQEFQMNVALNEYAFTKDRKKKRQLKKEIAQQLEAGIDGDFTVIKTLEGKPGPLDLLIPPSLHKYAYKGGYKGLGLKRSFWDIIIGTTLFIGIMLGVWTQLVKKDDPCLGGTQIEYQNLPLCLRTKSDSILYLEYLTKDSLKAGKIEEAQGLVNQTIVLADQLGVLDKSSESIDSNWNSYQKNIGRAFYNLGVQHANQADSLIFAKNATFRASKERACRYWQTAIDLRETGALSDEFVNEGNRKNINYLQNFCNFDEIFLHIDRTLVNTPLNNDLKAALRAEAFPVLEEDYSRVDDGKWVHYFSPEDEQVSRQIQQILNARYKVAQDSFQIKLVDERNDNIPLGRIDIYFDDGEKPIEYVNFQVQVRDSMTNNILSGISLRSPSVGSFNSIGQGVNQFRLAKPLPPSINIQVIRDGAVVKTVSSSINENQTNLTTIQVFVQNDVTLFGEIFVDDTLANNATIYLIDQPAIQYTTDQNGSYSLTIPGSLVQSNLPVIVEYQNNAFKDQLNPLIPQGSHNLRFIAPTTNNNQPPPVTNQFTDPRDGQVYSTVTINGLRWMAKNLNYVTPDSWCYLELPGLCEKAGRLYTWEAANRACPPGWHLPTDEEWKRLAEFAGGYYDVESGSNKKDPTLGYLSLIDKGTLGLTALLGGYRYSGGEFIYLGRDGYYWSSTERDAGNAWYYYFDGDGQRLDRRATTVSLWGSRVAVWRTISHLLIFEF